MNAGILMITGLSGGGGAMWMGAMWMAGSGGGAECLLPIANMEYHYTLKSGAALKNPIRR